MSALVHSNSQPLSLLFPPNPQFRNNPSPTSGRARGGGILINSSRSPSASPVSRSTSLPVTPENYGGATTSRPPSTAGDRKIRFAPLPDPRKLTSDEDSSIHESLEDDNKPSPVFSPDVVISEASGTSTISSSNSDEGGSSSRDNNSGNINNSNGIGKSSGGGSKKWKKKLLKPFLAASPVKSAFEDGGMLGTNLFRVSSKESFQSWNEQDTITEPPHRRRSTSAIDPPRPPTTTTSVPLRPTISADAPTKKLLNGRVYGQQRTKPQEQYRDPEFVEWGYGGMGSVKSGERFYNGVQSGGSMMRAGDGEDDDYDGSGMKWVQRRRAQREREAVERRKREAEEAAPVITVHSPPHTPKDEKNNRLTMSSISSSASLPPAHTPPASVPSSPPEQHDTTTVSVPHHHHSSHRGASRTTSGTTTPTIAKELKELNMTMGGGITGISASAPLSASTDGDDEEEDEEDEEEDDEKDGSDSEDDSAESEADESRPTCKSAGVEKVSRHRE